MEKPGIHSVEFVASGRGKAQCASNPAYPNGIEISIPTDAPFKCTVDLPYPAPECGHFLVKCSLCSTTIAVTAAGRRDDPTKITIPCQFEKAEGEA